VSTVITTNPHTPDPEAPRRYWEARAKRYAVVGDGLAAVCSYGMPAFYNRYTQALQRRALAPFLAVSPGASVLEIGCGIGRWSRQFADAGASVVGLDLSSTMVAEARRQTARCRVAAACRFLVSDVTAFSLRRRFDLIFGVTVLQHVLEPARLQAALDRIADHLAPGGRVVLLEAAPTIATGRCDSPIFVARDEATYRRAFERAGLSVQSVRAVDPAPFRMMLLPRYQALPRLVAVAGMLMATAASLAVDFGPWSPPVDASWHKVFVLDIQHRAGDGNR